MLFASSVLSDVSVSSIEPSVGLNSSDDASELIEFRFHSLILVRGLWLSFKFKKIYSSSLIAWLHSRLWLVWQRLLWAVGVI